MSSTASDTRGGAALPRFVIGALGGVAAGGVLVPRLPVSAALALLACGGALGAVAALVRPAAEALRHPALAAVASLAGVTMMVAAEPVFFLLVPLLAAAAASPLATVDGAPPLARWAV